jgi:hypothetical protein
MDQTFRWSKEKKRLNAYFLLKNMMIDQRKKVYHSSNTNIYPHLNLKRVANISCVYPGSTQVQFTCVVKTNEK